LLNDNTRSGYIRFTNGFLFAGAKDGNFVNLQGAWGSVGKNGGLNMFSSHGEYDPHREEVPGPGRLILGGKLTVYGNAYFSSNMYGSALNFSNIFETITYLDRKAQGTQGDSITSSNWVKVIPQTVQFSNTTAFTIASGVITVAAGGTGNWRVQGAVPFGQYAGATWSNGRSRIRRTSGTPATLANGSTVSFYYYDSVQSLLDGVIAVTAGDTLELQAYHSHPSTIYLGYVSPTTDSSGESNVLAQITFTRIK
jgi:hypothetical protein